MCNGLEVQGNCTHLQQELQPRGRLGQSSYRINKRLQQRRGRGKGEEKKKKKSVSRGRDINLRSPLLFGIKEEGIED